MPKVPSNSYLSGPVAAPGPRPSDANLLMAAAVMHEQGRLIPQNDEASDPPARLVGPGFNVRTGKEDPSIKTEEDFLKNLPEDFEATRSEGSKLYTIRPRKKEKPKLEDLVS